MLRHEIVIEDWVVIQEGERSVQAARAEATRIEGEGKGMKGHSRYFCLLNFFHGIISHQLFQI